MGWVLMRGKIALLLKVAGDSVSAVPKESGRSRKVKQEAVDNVQAIISMKH
jgi:hypothetical protein